MKFPTNPFMVFVYAIISKWYLFISVTAIITVFWVFKGLESAGVLEKAGIILLKVANEVKGVAKYCVPKIANLQNFVSCLQDTPNYEPDNSEKDLYNVPNYEPDE